jgi:hypothetical protein
VKFLLEKSQTGRSIIHWAAVGGHNEIINYVHNDYQLPVDEADEVEHEHITNKNKFGRIFALFFDF